MAKKPNMRDVNREMSEATKLIEELREHLKTHGRRIVELEKTVAQLEDDNETLTDALHILSRPSR